MPHDSYGLQLNRASLVRRARPRSDETKAALERAGLRVSAWEYVAERALGWVGQQQAGPLPALTTDLVVGPRMGSMVTNFGRNVKEGRVRLVMGVCDAA